MVYVDDAMIPYGRMKMCHMIADTTQELLDMVDMRQPPTVTPSGVLVYNLT